MTRVAPMEAETLDATPRRPMTPTRRARIIAGTDGHCAKCDIREGLEIDHITPLWLSGADDDANCIALCRTHHAEKTARDAAIRSKVKRQKARHEGAEPPPTQAIRSRGFQRRWA